MLSFSHLARSAFIAISLLKSLHTIHCITRDQFDDYLSSLRTVPSKMQEDAHNVNVNKMSWTDFVHSYGHLRPSSYDITSLCYESAPNEYLMPFILNSKKPNSIETQVWGKEVQQAIDNELVKNEFDISVEQFEGFLRTAIEGREYGKFIFTKNLNASLEAIAEFGLEYGVTREQLSCIRIKELLELCSANVEDMNKKISQLVLEGEKAYKVTQNIVLPGQIFSETDFICIEQTKAEPNFITQKKVHANVISLDGHVSPKLDLSGKIVVIPNADPGFDWLFGRDIVGLITMYGGVNSHMAIRVAELELAAAIGVGEILFEKIIQAEVLELDCKGRQIIILR
jgi:hypothetical protein